MNKKDLHDYYAGVALQGLLANPNLLSCHDFLLIAEGTKGGKDFINAANYLADAMLEARNETR